jgi:GR25 family glycosyltransferase involved in LPS biosynthesis
MSYKIFYINLDKSINRNKKIQGELNKTFPGTVINRFPAINRENLSDSYIKNLLNPRSYYYLETNNHKRAIHEDINNKGHIGCYLSHLNLWQQLLDDNTTDYYIIFEDDMNINKELKNVVDKLFRENVDFDFISLIYVSRRINDKVNKNYPYLYNLKNPFFGAQCYMLNKKSAEALVRWSKELTAQADAFIGYVALYEHNLNFYMYKEPLGNTNIFSSTIQHGNCIHCVGDDLFQIKIKTGFGLKNKNSINDGRDNNYIVLNLKFVLILVLLIILIYTVYKNYKNG